VRRRGQRGCAWEVLSNGIFGFGNDAPDVFRADVNQRLTGWRPIALRKYSVDDRSVDGLQNNGSGPVPRKFRSATAAMACWRRFRFRPGHRRMAVFSVRTICFCWSPGY